MVTQEFRGTMNQLVGELKYYLAYLLSNQGNDINGQSSPFMSHTFMVDPYFRYSDHGICEANVHDPSTIHKHGSST